MAEILTVSESPVAVVDAVVLESQFVYEGAAGEKARTREAVDLRPLLATGVLRAVDDFTDLELTT